MSRTRTEVKDVLEKDSAKELYLYLKKNVPWEDGIRSKSGHTRKAYSVQLGDSVSEFVLGPILLAMKSFNLETNTMMGIYLNYYVDGNSWTPNHTHKNSNQLVISLGTTRTLEVGKKSFEMESGQAILFGSSVHGVPKDESIKRGRISIAVFLVK